MRKEWIICYTFYDDKHPKRVRRMKIRGMNRARNWRDRIDATRTLIKAEETALALGYHALHKAYMDAQGNLHTTPPPILSVSGKDQEIPVGISQDLDISIPVNKQETPIQVQPINEIPEAEKIPLKPGNSPLLDNDTLSKKIFKTSFWSNPEFIYSGDIKPNKIIDEAPNGIITSQTPLPIAFIIAFKTLSRENRPSLSDDKGRTIYILRAIKHLGLSNLPVSAITRQYCLKILEQCGKDFIKDWEVQRSMPEKTVNGLKFGRRRGDGQWTNNAFNYHKKTLSLIVNLVGDDIIPYNPVEKIDTAKHIKAKRVPLTDKERTDIIEHLPKVNPALLRYIDLYYHSLNRNTEMLRIQRFELEQIFKSSTLSVLKLKGQNTGEKQIPIKDNSVHLWRELYEMPNPVTKRCDPMDYIFSKGLVPGTSPVSEKYPSEQWAKYVKDPNEGLGINKNIGRVRAAAVTEARNEAGAEANKHRDELVRKLTGHSSIQVINKHYDEQAEERRVTDVRDFKTSFAPAKKD